jgi:hypothetical protein
VANGITSQIRVSEQTLAFYYDFGRDSADGFFSINGNQGLGYKWKSAGTERMRIDSSGNLGIANSAPSNKLSVGDGTADTRAVFSPNSAFAIGVANGAGFAGWIGGSGTTDTMVFSNSGGTERMRITPTGDVGIGTSSPGGKIEASSSGQNIIISRSTGSYAAFQRYAPTGQFCYDFYTINNVEVARITATGTNLVFSTGSAATDRMVIDSSGNVGIGATANASAILDAQSTTKGVRMPNMTTTQKNAISSPAAGLMVFDTTLAKLCVYSGSAWQTITSV